MPFRWSQHATGIDDNFLDSPDESGPERRRHPMTIWLVTAVVIQTSDGPGYLTLYHRNRPQTTYVLDFIGIGGCQFEHSSIADDRVKPSRYPEFRSSSCTL